MKNVLRLLVFAALVTVFALPAYAQDAAAQTPAATGPCSPAEAEARAALYGKFRENFNKTAEQQKIAYESGKEYVSKYGTCTEASEQQIVKYIQNWLGKYEKAAGEFNCTKAANDNPAEAFNVCAPLIQAKPDDLKLRLTLVGAGIKAYTNKNNSLNTRATAEARTALQMIESGKTIDVWAPFKDQQEARAGLSYWIAVWSLEANPAESATQLLKVAQSGDTMAKEPATFQLLATSYYNAELKPKVDEYKAKCEGKEATPECDALLHKINVVLDRVIDSYARAVALSNANPKYGATATALRPILTNLYKQRHEGQEAGLNELIGKVLSTPVPLPSQDPAYTPPPAATNGTTSNGMTPAGTTATTPASGTTTAKPAATATPTPAPKPATPAQKPPRS
jgi:hypothetical protein